MAVGPVGVVALGGVVSFVNAHATASAFTGLADAQPASAPAVSAKAASFCRSLIVPPLQWIITVAAAATENCRLGERATVGINRRSRVPPRR
jgi:hypothetical protein